MKRYQPSNRVPSTGFMWLLLSSILGGMTFGGLTFFISRLFYLIFLFPIAMGVAGGMVNGLGISKGKVRNPWVGATFGVLTGLTICGTLHGGEYFSFRQEAAQHIREELGQVDDATAGVAIDAFLEQETGAAGFFGFLQSNAKQGVSIGKLGQEGVSLGKTGTWIYWSVELAAIATIAGFLGYAAAKEPFCEKCDRWYDAPKRLGYVEANSSATFLGLAKRDCFLPSGKLINLSDQLPAPSLEVRIQGCPHCKQSDTLLVANVVASDEKGNLQFEEVLQGMLSPREYAQLWQGVEERDRATEQAPTPDSVTSDFS
jgi:hypothetical protein